MNKPLVSIGIPLYNHEKFVEECLLSIINQTYENIEIIIIDDGSKDKSYEIAKKVLEAQTRRKYKLITRPNQGLCKTLNEIVSYITGEFFAALASDDYLREDRISLQVDFLIEHQGIGLVHSNCYVVDNQSQIVGYRDISHLKVNGDIFKGLLDGGSGIITPTALFRSSIFSEIGHYDESFKIEDTDFWLRLTKVYNVGFINDFLVYYRRHENNLSHNDNLLKFSNDEVVKILYKNIDDIDLLKDSVCRIYRKSYLRALKKGYLEIFLKYIILYIKTYFLKTQQQKILIFRLSALGDLITLEGTFRAIRYFYPNAHITFVSSAVGKDLYENSGYFDRIVTFRRRDVFKNIGIFLRYQYDLTFNLQCSRVSHFFLTFVRTGKTVDSGSSLWQRFFGIKGRGKNLSQILQLSGIDSSLVSSYMQQPDQNIISLPYEVIDYGWSKSKKVVALAPGASERWESKKWGDARYLELASQLIQENFTVILVGSHLEKDVGVLIEGKYPQVINLIGKTTLSELKSVLASVDIVVCNDSGPAHLAAGVGTDTITIFGSTGEKFCVKYMPYRGRHECFVPKGLSCHPCYKSKCPTKSECMDQTTVENVYEMVKSVIRGES